MATENPSTTSLAGSHLSSDWECLQCVELRDTAKARERELLDELETSRRLAARYKYELSEAQTELKKIKEETVSDELPRNISPLPDNWQKRKHSLFHQSSSTEEQPKDVNVFSRRRSSVGCVNEEVPVPSLHPDAPPSYEEKKWWKGEGTSPRCPRGCFKIERTRREHYKKRHYNVYYAFVNNVDNYSERERWLCTLFGDKATGPRVCLHCEHMHKRGSTYTGQLELVHHIKEEHPDKFAELAVAHSRHCSNTANVHQIPQLPGEIDLLLEKTRKVSISEEKPHIHKHSLLLFT